MARPVSRRWISGLALLATLHLLLFYGLPGGFKLAVLIGLGIFYFRAGAMAATATTLSLGLATLFCAVAIHLLGLDRSMYYRPHEQLVRQDYDEGHRAYRKHARVEMRMPHGDLKALSSAPLAQPRQVLFQTDGAGYRNDHEYANGQVVLIGDSFVVGVGDSQADTLSTQLERDHGIPSYNLGHPGDIPDYLDTLRAFREKHPGPMRGLLFLFEGNDFNAAYQPARLEKPNLLARWAGKYYSLFTGTDLYRVTKSLYARATKSRGIAASSTVHIETVAGQPMGFYTPYTDVSLRRDYTFSPAMTHDLIALAGQMEQVFFIPTNYRVYAAALGRPAPPHAQWQALAALCAKQGWRCTDLTPALTGASTTLLKQGELTWWRDDTHWNRQGMAVAAAVVAKEVMANAAAAARPKHAELAP